MYSTENGSITVDKDFARFGSKSYAINKISSIEVRQSRKSGWPPVIAALFVAGFCIAAMIGGERVPSVRIALAAALIAAGYFFMTKDVVIYRLIIVTSAQEIQAFTTKDGPQMKALRAAIEAAMMGRA